MTKKEHIQKEVDKTLESLDGISRAQANPYLFTRIKARMERNQGPWEKVSSYVSRPIFALAILGFVMLINALVVFNSGSGTVQEDNAAVSSIVDEYSMSFATTFDYENGENNELSQK
jgi:hypothetical protein